MTSMVTIDRRLYLTADRKQVVEDGDPRAHWLWAAKGDEVLREEAERLGALKPEPAKQMAPPANKQMPAPANKARR